MLFYDSLPEPKCEADDTELIVTMGIDKRADQSQPEIEFKIGGKLLSNGSVSIHKELPYLTFGEQSIPEPVNPGGHDPHLNLSLKL